MIDEVNKLIDDAKALADGRGDIPRDLWAFVRRVANLNGPGEAEGPKGSGVTEQQAQYMLGACRDIPTSPAPAPPALGDTVCGLPLTSDVSCQMREGHQIDHLALAVSRATPLSDTEREELEKFRWVQKHAVLIVASDPHVAEADRGTGACRQIVDALTHIGRGT